MAGVEVGSHRLLHYWGISKTLLLAVNNLQARVTLDRNSVAKRFVPKLLHLLHASWDSGHDLFFRYLARRQNYTIIKMPFLTFVIR